MKKLDRFAAGWRIDRLKPITSNKRKKEYEPQIR